MSIHVFIPESTTETNGSSSSPNGRPRPQRRLVHVCTRFAKGGSEQRLRDMIAALPHDEHIVIVGGDSDLEAAVDKLPQARVIMEPALLRSINPWRDPTALLRLRRHIRDLKCDVVVTHQSKAGLLGRLAAKAAGAPPVVHSLSMADFGPGYGAVEGRLFRLLERVLARWTTAYAVVGSDLARRFGRIGIPEERMTVIRSAARLPRTGTSQSELRRHVAQKYGLPEDRPWILYVGSLDQRKNVLDLPIMLQQVLQLCTDSLPFLVIAGAGPLEQELRSLTEKIGVGGDCQLLGYVADPGDLFLTADAVILLSKAEGLPQVLVQAAAAGTPFVSTDIDGADELLEMGASGSVVEIGDIVGAARALLPYLRWPVQRKTTKIDLSSWNPVRVRSDYRNLFTTVLNPPKPEKNHGLVVAVIGPDGAGKSSLCAAIAARQPDLGVPIVPVYLGSGQRQSSVLRPPIISAKRRLLGATGRRRKKPIEERSKEPWEAARSIWALAIARQKRNKLRRIQRARASGALVVSDRFPHVQMAGTTDGPQLDSWRTSEQRWRRSLSRWERHPYELADAFQPDLVIRLRVSQENALTRRPDHDPEHLVATRVIVDQLQFERSRLGIVDLDADQPFAAVVEEALGVITDHITPTAAGPA